MEKVWDELKKIEAHAELIRSEAQNKAKKLNDLSQQEAEMLIANSKTYAEEEAQQLYANAIEEANRNSEEQLKANQQATQTLKAKGKKRMDQASLAVVNSVLGETKP
jgi:vacuolar-type H+-ATPase subunit H